ncbi:MAG: sortase [Chloroflexota bacterium]
MKNIIKTAGLFLFLLVWNVSLVVPPAVSAAPRLAAVPGVTISAPGPIFIGNSFSFTVTFDNTGADTGYGPHLDVFLPLSGADGSTSGGPDDGISFGSATYLGTPVTTQTLACPAGGNVTHPLTGGTIACPPQPGGLFSPFVWQMVVITLPFGSFVPGQPPAEVTINASLSNYADLNVPLPIWAGGGFMFGQDPLNNPVTDPPLEGARVETSPNPTAALITLTKTYQGPEDETATGPNYLRRYTVTAQIATGQSLTNFNLSDVLPDNMQFVSLVSTSPAGAGCSLPSTSIPGGTISCNFPGSVSGTVSLTFEFFIPLLDAGSASVIDPVSGNDALSCNNASASGDWTPLDPRDSTTTIMVNPDGCEHTLTDKSIAIQKSVTNLSPAPLSPGDVLEYTLDIQVSDFFVFDRVVVTDVISDGQRWDSTFTPTLQVSGNPSTYDSSGSISTANYTVDTSQIGNSGPNPPDDGTNGTTTITFRVSDEIITRGQDGRLIGGCVPPSGTGGSDPICGTYNNLATTARIVFRTVVQEAFSDTYPSSDASVDQNDILTNAVTVAGRLLSTSDASTPTGDTEEDTSGSSLRIPQGTISKSIYALNGSTSLSTPVRVAPGDVLTYRVQYSLPTSDFEDLVITDYLPLPVFDAAEVTSFSNAPCTGTGIPLAGQACLGPADTYHTLSGAVSPGFSTSGMSANNSLTWTYGDYDAPNNPASEIDLLFSVTVRTDPFADGLFLTNQANGQEGATNSTGASSNGIIQIQLQEPVLNISKGVVWTNNSAAQFTPTAVGPVTFDGSAATCAARLGDTITSGGLAATPVNSNVSRVDAGDTLMMAVIIENTGRWSAYDVSVRDSLPAGMTLESGSLCVTDGTGAAFTYSGSESDFFSAARITLGDPGPTTTPAGALDPGLQGDGTVINDGRNIAVITYRVTLDSTVNTGSTLTNTATLFNYAGAEGGPNHIPGGLSDDASVTIANPTVDKQFVSSEINDANNGNTQTVIGELVTYTVTLTVPEGVTTNAQLVDTLDSGLAFVDCQSITASANLTTDLTGGFSAACTSPGVTDSGRTVTFDLGTITNTNTDNSTPETITLTYRAVVLNVPGNQAGTQLNNSARLTWSNGSATASAANVTVIEPQIQVSKSVTPVSTDAGNTVTFTVTLSNPASGSTTAYEVSWEDAVPAGLNYVGGSALGACGSTTLTFAYDSGTRTLSLASPIGQLDPGQSCTITFDATVDYTVSPGQTITNTAEARWSSLSGTVTDRSSYNSDSDERDGSGGINDYRSQGSVDLTIQSAAPNKYLVATSEAHTGVVSGTPRVAIGEIVRYRVVVQVPEGSSPNFQIQDLLPSGLQFLDDGTTRYALVADGTGITSTAVGSVPAVTTAGCTVSGTSADASTPATLPCSLPDANIGSDSSTSSDPDSYGSDSDPYFKFGSLTNNDNDADGEFVVVEFNALVLNIGGNTAGTTRSNSARVLINGSQNGSDAAVVNVVIAEPDLTIGKSGTSISDAGDIITYTLTITAANSGSNRATAFDLSVTDTLDTYLTPDTSSVSITSTPGTTCTGNGGGTTAFSTGSSWSGSTLTLTVTATCLDPGQSITVSFSATINANVPAGYTIPNTGNLSYTSLPGSNGTTGNPTGSTTPGTSGSGTGERVTNRSAMLNRTISAPAISKQAPFASGYPIGALVTYPIRITLPEGVTRNLRVTDAVPDGMQYVSYTLDTTGFNGSVAVSTVTGGASDGDDVTFTFGDTTTTDDNVPDNNAFTLNVTLRVLDVTGNQIGSTLVNSASLIYTPGTGSSDTTIPGGSQTITVIEPRIQTDKSVTPASGVDAGDTVTYTVHFTNTGTAAAYEVTAQDVLAQGVTYNNDAACQYYDGSTTTSIGVTVTPGSGTLTFDGNPAGSWDIPATDPDSYIECTYTATAQSSLYLDGPHTNTVDADWSSLDGSDSNERVYDDSVSRTVDGTQDTDTASFSSPAPTIAKSDGNTSGAVIGQTITYTLTLNSPSGTLRDLLIEDTLPAGLIYISGTQSVSSGISPAPAFTVSSPNDGSAPVTLEWNFGDAVISSSPVTITFQAQVANVSSNQDGVNRNNTTTLNYTNAVGVSVTQTASDDLTIREPALEVVKTVSDSAPPPGGTVTYTLTIRHTAASTADAYDLSLTDVIPSGLSYVTDSLTHVSGVDPTSLSDSSAPTLSASWSSLPLGSQSVLSYQVDVPAGSNGQSYTNTATLSWSSLSGTVSGERDGSGGVNDYSTSGQASLTSTGPDLAIQKTDGDSGSAPGGVIVYTLTYANNGNGAASGVVVTETVPLNTTFVAASSSAGWSCADGSAAGTTCTYTIGTLAGGGAGGTLTFAVRVVNPLPAGVNQIENAVLIGDDGSRGPDPTPTNNTSTDTTPLSAAPDLAIVKDDGVSVAQPGDLLVYTLTYANNGNQTATGVVVTETVPLHTTFVAGSSSAGWSCADGSAAGTTCTYTIGTLAGGGAGGTLTFAVRVDNPVPEGVTQIVNTVTIRDDGTNGSDPTPGNNTSTDTDDLTAEPDLAISKSDGVSVAQPGDLLVYTLTYANNGNQTATGVVITETVPLHTTFVAASSTTGWSCADGSPGGTTCTYTIGTLAGGGAGGTLTFAVRVDNPVPEGVTQVVNTVTIGDDGQNGEDTTPDDNTATDTDDLTAAPDLAIVKDDGVSVAQPGDLLVYALTYANNGNQTATGVVITETVPLHTTFVAASSTTGWSCADGDPGGTTCTYTIGTLAGGGAGGTLTFAVRVVNPVPEGVTQVVNTVTIGDDGTNGSDPTPADNTSTDTDDLTAAPDLTISKDDGVSVAQPGDLLVYTLTYANNGNQTATGVEITETVPLHTTFVAASSSAGWSCADGSPGGTTCTYTIGTLAGGGAGGTLNFAVRVDNPVPEGVTQVVNTVTIGDDGTNGSDPTPDDNTSTDTDDLTAAPDLAISKSDGVSVTAPGATLTYTLRIENRGNQTATGVVVTDTLPVGVTFVSASDGGTYEESSRQVTWPAFDLAAGAPAEVRTLTVRVNDPLEAGITRLLNTAVVRDDGQNGEDTTPDDNTATDEDRLGSGGKQIVTTNQDFTALPSVAVGEVLTYEVRFTVEAGQQVQNLTFSDVLDEGLAFVACDEITATAEGLISSRGALSNLCAAAVIGSYPPGSSEPQHRGRYMTLDFGNVENPTQQDIEMIIRYRVVVLNGPANERGTLLTNQAEWKWDGGVLPLRAAAVRVVEPALSVTKTVDPDVALPGSKVTYRLIVKPDPDSDTSAWDVLLTDAVPRGLSYVPGSLRFVSGLLPDVMDDSAAPLLQIGWQVFPPDATETILAFDAEVGNLPPGDQVENTALLTWSSLPGSVQSPQSPYNPLSDERRFQPGSSLNTYGRQSDAQISVPVLPATGFAPQRVTPLPVEPAGGAYSSLPDLLLEIPALGVRRPIVGVPLQNGQWDLTWLSSQIGWLEGSAYPTLAGNTALTAHVYDANGLPGAFVNLHTLKWGDVILIRTPNATYHYEVREVRRVQPTDLSVMRHEERDWLTLITCQGYQEVQNRYQWRVAVRAVLVKVTP